MSKNVFMPGDALTEEQRESIRKANADQQNQEISAKQEVLRTREELLREHAENLKKLYSTNIKPQEDRILVFPDMVDIITEGGILKPEETVERERPMRGTVVGIGPGKVDHATVTNKLLVMLIKTTGSPVAEEAQKLIESNAPALQVGDRIMYGRYAGTPIEDEKTKVEVLIMRPTDIFVKL